MGTIASLLPPVTTAADSGSSTTIGNAAFTPPSQPQPQPQLSANGSSDAVQLTEAQQVYQLYNQGMQIPQIASNLSLSVAAVNSYLNISNKGS
jgi:DNA-binding NarL/FixJ family response regulator